MILDEEMQDDHLRTSIFAKIPKDKLASFIATVNDLARPYDDNFHNEMIEQYGRVRRFLPKMLSDIDFKAAPAGKSIVKVINYLASIGTSRKQFLEDAPLNILTEPWKRLVFDEKGRVTKRAYTFCFLEKFQDAFRRRDVYVENSDRWGDPRAKLLHGADWRTNRVQVCRSLGHPLSPKNAINGLDRQLDTAYKQVAANFNDNNSVSLDLSGKRPSLTITNLD